MYFSDIPLQEKVKQYVSRSLQEDRQSHATLYKGPVGSAVLPVALAVARNLLCAERSACGKCSSCQAMDKFMHPDLQFFFPSVRIEGGDTKQQASRAAYQEAWRKFIKQYPYGGLQRWIKHLEQTEISAAAQKNLFISRDEVRCLLSMASLAPFMSKLSVLFVWLPERLHPVAANALLKTLEDPSTRCLFLFVSHAPQKILPTLRSRVQQIQLPPFSVVELSNYLQKAHNLSKERTTQIAQQACGDMDYALQLVMTEEEPDTALLREWLRSCWLYKSEGIMTVSEEFFGLSRLGQQAFLRESLHLFRQSLLQKAGAVQIARPTAALRDFVQNFSSTISFDVLEKLITSSNSMLNCLEQNAHPKMLFLSHAFQIAEEQQEEMHFRVKVLQCCWASFFILIRCCFCYFSLLSAAVFCRL